MHRIPLVPALAALILLPAPTLRPAVGATRLLGHYTDAQLGDVKSFTLPRTFLYDARGRLVPREEWPGELAEVSRKAGDAFCCASAAPASPGGGPPADCVKVIYGSDVSGNFKGLLDAAGKPIALEALAPHEFLLVEYFASWCAPCVEERRALEAFFATAGAERFVWLTIDMSRLAEAREAARKSK